MTMQIVVTGRGERPGGRGLGRPASTSLRAPPKVGDILRGRRGRLRIGCAGLRVLSRGECYKEGSAMERWAGSRSGFFHSKGEELGRHFSRGGEYKDGEDEIGSSALRG